MSDEETARVLATSLGQPLAASTMMVALRMVRENEREACARIADDFARRVRETPCEDNWFADVATAIRART